jgi:hypothetical protein
LKTIFVAYDPTQPELMEKIEEHWRVGITITRSEKVKNKIINEWKAGNCKILFHEEVLECLSQNNQSKSG